MIVFDLPERHCRYYWLQVRRESERALLGCLLRVCRLRKQCWWIIIRFTSYYPSALSFDPVNVVFILSTILFYCIIWKFSELLVKKRESLSSWQPLNYHDGRHWWPTDLDQVIIILAVVWSWWACTYFTTRRHWVRAHACVLRHQDGEWLPGYTCDYWFWRLYN